MNILVTAIGSMSAECVISTLKRKGHTVFGCDIYPSEWHSISNACKKVYLAPPAIDESNYINFLNRIIQENNISFIFPLTDIEIDIIRQNKERNLDKNVTFCISNNNALSIARNKYNLYLAFKDDNRITSLHTLLSSDPDAINLSLPCIAKPCNGRSSEGIKRIFSQEELLQACKLENYIIQEYIKGPVYTIDYVRSSKTQNDFCILREELLRTSNGAGTVVRITNNKKLKELASIIGQKLNINGCVNMEFIENNNKFYLIDINPRFSAGIGFSCLTGYDMVTSHLNCYLQQDILPGIVYNEQIMRKRFVDEIIK